MYTYIHTYIYINGENIVLFHTSCRPAQMLICSPLTLFHLPSPLLSAKSGVLIQKVCYSVLTEMDKSD